MVRPESAAGSRSRPHWRCAGVALRCARLRAQVLLLYIEIRATQHRCFDLREFAILRVCMSKLMNFPELLDNMNSHRLRKFGARRLGEALLA